MRLPFVLVFFMTGVAFQTAAIAVVAPVQTRQTKLIGVTSSGEPLDSDCFGASLSEDGRFVAYSTRSDEVVAGDTNGTYDVFVADRQTGVTELVSVTPTGVPGNGGSGGAVISADGRFIAFVSAASDLVAGDLNQFDDVFVRDRRDGVTTRVSVGAFGAEGNFPSEQFDLSKDGRFVVFQSLANNLVPNDTNGCDDIFIHDRMTGVTERVSVDSAGIEGNRLSEGPSLSANGRWVCFTSQATNLVPVDFNGCFDVFVRDRWKGTTERASLTTAGQQANAQSIGSISEDGNVVFFGSDATNLVARDKNGVWDLFVRDRRHATTTRVSVDSSGAEANGQSYGRGLMTPDGAIVFFLSQATNLIANDTNGYTDIFRHNVHTGTTSRVNDASVIVDDASSLDMTADLSVIGFNGHASISIPPLLASGRPFFWKEVFVHGPFLTLVAEPEIVPAGGEVTFSVWDGGAPLGQGFLVVVDVNGVPTFDPLTGILFDVTGRWHKTLVTPPQLAGTVVTVVGSAPASSGAVVRTNLVTVTFQ